MKEEVKKSLRDALGEMKSSKKFLVLISTVVCWGISVIGLKMDPNDLVGPIGAVSAWLVGQGQADRGKEAEKEKNKRGHEDYDDDTVEA